MTCAAVFGAVVMLTAPAPAAESRCPAGNAESVTVRSVPDGLALLLTDGRAIRLAGIEVPQQDDAAAEQARARLQALLGSEAVSLRRLEEAADRYGRLPAFVYVPGERASVQERLLQQGLARVAARAGGVACARPLHRAEQEARAAGRGLWSEARVLRRADTPADVLADRGRLSLVEGRVISVRESGATIYVNFGRRWTEDFTASLPKRRERAFAVAGVDLKALAGRTVRIRGVVEERGGPWIELLWPEQVELDAGR